LISAVIFDIDGTLIDSVDAHAQAWVGAFHRFGKDVPFDQVRSQIGKGGDQLMPVFLSDEEFALSGEELEAWRSEHVKRNFLPKLRPFPKVRELFKRILADGKQVALASSAKADEVNEYVKIAGVADLIGEDEIVTSGDVAKSKPHPDIFEAVMAKLGGIAPSQAIGVGDSPYDAVAANKAGLKLIGVLCGGFPETDLARSFRTHDAPILRSDHQVPRAEEAVVGSCERPVGAFLRPARPWISWRIGTWVAKKFVGFPPFQAMRHGNCRSNSSSRCRPPRSALEISCGRCDYFEDTCFAWFVRP
jgi:HAD superfamily hydrolase (TIGR01549 family)